MNCPICNNKLHSIKKRYDSAYSVYSSTVCQNKLHEYNLSEYELSYYENTLELETYRFIINNKFIEFRFTKDKFMIFTFKEMIYYSDRGIWNYSKFDSDEKRERILFLL